ncbi:MAG: deoxyribose-phosphate aldolase, partial [Calditrichaeota bacterium]|nr:deoxyribose-phosphate aldolase [Calditrichota bacterium]
MTNNEIKAIIDSFVFNMKRNYTFRPLYKHQPADASELESIIDYTLLSPNASRADIHQMCINSKSHSFHSICIAPCWVEEVQSLIKNDKTKLCTVIGFPHGTSSYSNKINECEDTLQKAVDEIDMVMNLSAFKSQSYDYVISEIKEIVHLCHRHKVLLKVIIEIAYLNEVEIIQACLLAHWGGADFVKTSSGFARSGATVEAVRLMRQVVMDNMGVKAAGGIHEKSFAIELL